MERRNSIRFSFEFSAELSVGKLQIQGKTANISSGGLLMNCSDGQLEKSRARLGSRVKVRITGWPSSRTNDGNMTLVMEGVIVRKLNQLVAIRRTKYRFTDAEAGA